ncbi:MULTISPECIES: nitroreductase [unclassified Imperialibacter]|uniref:nitroreductase family protein n=1 Tax=unclassified Imperialibacter TaxID=2629706 RepID=UPI001256747F|nr:MULTISPECIES: nitroreductase [unclassified Imperialibacter]CAD5269803.1 Nitroreductase [Imperialibacter sp. 89]CAD5297829.1 Nitroreductase [Imperialibacter sp. 75]VVT34210.1 Nitroreductase [Imperialibacter sp. EC-SDR9]
MFNTEEFNRLIKHRRSIYTGQFTGEKVDEAVIHQMLENANWAPTHGLTEPWRFTVFTGDGIQKLAAFQAELFKKVTTAQGNFNEGKYEGLKTKPLTSSHIIGIGMKRDAKGKIREIEEVEAVACAVENMYLTAAAYGVGCYWGSGGITYMEEAKSFFGLGENDKFLGFLFVGVAGSKWPEGNRGSVEEKTTWVR